MSKSSRNHSQGRSILLCILCFLSWTGVAQGQGEKFEFEIWCPDLNDDNIVNFLDVEILAADRGDCPDAPALCASDINGNRHVGKIDLLYLIASWGPCRCKGDLNQDGLLDDEDLRLMDEAVLEDPNCGTDINFSGAVEGIDYFIVIDAWGSDPDSDQRSDIDQDGGLGADDVADVMFNLASNVECHGDLTIDGRIDSADRDMLQRRIDLGETCDES